MLLTSHASSPKLLTWHVKAQEALTFRSKGLEPLTLAVKAAIHHRKQAQGDNHPLLLQNQLLLLQFQQPLQEPHNKPHLLL